MDFRLIDYSEGFYGDRVPRERRGKFIQVRSGGAEYLVLAPRELCVYHANIAERFFASMGLTGRYNAKRDDFRVAAPGWRVVGGGHWSADDVKNQLKLSGESMAYGRFDARGLAKRLAALDALAGYTITVGG